MPGNQTLWTWVTRHWLLEAVAVMLLVGAVGLVRFDQVIEVSYRRVPVVRVDQVPGGDLVERAVVVDLGDRQRLVVTTDWMIRARPGVPVCIAESRLLLRRYTRVRLALPGYCGPLPPSGEGPAMSASPSPSARFP